MATPESKQGPLPRNNSSKLKQIVDQSLYQPLDGGYGWIIVLGGAFTHFLLVGMARCLGVIYLVLRERYEGTAQETAWAAAIFNTTRTLMAPLCGMLCSRIGCRKVALLGAAVLCSGFVITAFATSLVYIYISFGILTGFGGALVFTPVYIIVAQYFDKKKGKAMAFATLGSGLGNVVLAPLISYLVQYYGYFGAMLLLGALQLNNAVSAMAYVPLHMLSQLKPEYLRAQMKPRFGADEPHEYRGEQAPAAEKVDAPLLKIEQKEASIQSHQMEEESNRKYSGEKNTNEEETDDLHQIRKTNSDNNDDTIAQQSQEMKSVEENKDVPKENNDANNKELSSVQVLTNSTHQSDTSQLSSAPGGAVSGGETGQCVRCQRVNKSLLCNWSFLVYGVMIMCMQANIQTFLIFLPGLAQELGGADKIQAALMLSIMGFADMGGRFIWGFVFDIRSVRSRRRHAYCLVTLVFALCTISMAVMRSYLAIAIMTALTGVFEGGSHSQRATVVSEFVPSHQMATAVGFVIFFQGIGNIWGPPIGGYLRDVTGTSSLCYVFSGGALLVFTLVFVVQAAARHHCCPQEVVHHNAHHHHHPARV